jgi:hypothetical protein
MLPLTDFPLYPYYLSGAVSFGQIVKAGEPVFAAATNAILLGVSFSLWFCLHALYHLVLSCLSHVLPSSSPSLFGLLPTTSCPTFLSRPYHDDLILIAIPPSLSSSLLQDIDHPMVYAALIPIIGGVGLASLKELSFTWTALIAASLANQAAAFKNVVSKGVMGKPWAKALGPQNTYSVVTILALLFTM